MRRRTKEPIIQRVQREPNIVLEAPSSDGPSTFVLDDFNKEVLVQINSDTRGPSSTILWLRKKIKTK
jgi:hypothetical protein